MSRNVLKNVEDFKFIMNIFPELNCKSYKLKNNCWFWIIFRNSSLNFFLSNTETAGFYREVWNIGNESVDVDAFVLVANERGYFVRALLLSDFLHDNSTDNEKN